MFQKHAEALLMYNYIIVVYTQNIQIIFKVQTVLYFCLVGLD